ncbi:MAG: class I SAM-dependent methyltransferase [Ardenticatenaceae bacterium]|nr:class I SAM-dependent methyltransferase [Ardenticatenaceae bacterium]
MSGTYDSELYDIIVPQTFLGDVEWYRDKAVACGGPVLELGAGTGRITIPIAAAGVPIHALDIDDGMLKRLRAHLEEQEPLIRERVTVVKASMSDFALDSRFALVIIPARAFLHNVTESDQLACLACVRRHLQPGGRLAFNFFHPSLEFMAQHAGPLAGVWRWTDTRDLPDGRQLVVSEANRYDTVRQVVHSRHRHEIYSAGGELERTFLSTLDLAYLYRGDVLRLLEAAGFADVQITGGFDGRPFGADGDELVVEAVVSKRVS